VDQSPRIATDNSGRTIIYFRVHGRAMLKQAEGAGRIQGKIGSALAVIPLSPNQWTLLSVVAALAAGAVIALRADLGLGLILFAVAALLDMVDGAVARARGEVT
jgi:hypothetical protein